MFYILMIRTFQKSAALLSCFAWKWLCLLYRPNQNKRIPCVLLMLTHSLPNWSIPQLRQRRCLFSSVDKKCMYSRILMSTWQNMIFHWVFVVVAFNVVVFFDWCLRRELMFTSNQVLSCSISDCCRCSTFPSKQGEKQIALERSLILTLVLVYIFFLLVDLKGGDRRPEKGRGWSNL